MTATLPDLVTIATGEARPIVGRYPNGSFICPWCHSTVIAGHDPQWATRQCCNAACWAYPGVTAERIRQEQAEDAEREVEAARRRHATAVRAAYMEQVKARQAALWQDLADQAKANGQCLRCLIESDWRSGQPKFIRHRCADYHDPGAAS